MTTLHRTHSNLWTAVVRVGSAETNHTEGEGGRGWRGRGGGGGGGGGVVHVVSAEMNHTEGEGEREGEWFEWVQQRRTTAVQGMNHLPLPFPLGLQWFVSAEPTQTTPPPSPRTFTNHFTTQKALCVEVIKLGWGGSTIPNLLEPHRHKGIKVCRVPIH